MRSNRFGKNIRLLKIISNTFGLSIKYVFLFVFNTFLRWLNSLFFLLDALFYPSLKKQTLDRPIYLIGHLRSGTTFLHRFLSRNCIELRPLYLLEMILPALTLKKILKPFFPGINKISLDKVYDPKIHKTGLNKEETDDIALYFRYLDGMLSWIYFHAWQKFESPEKLHKSIMDICKQYKFVNYLKKLYKILSFQSKKRILSKSFSSLFYLEEMILENPGARFIILIRDPKEAIPSLMSLEESVQNKMHGKKNVEKNRTQYFKNLYELSVYYYSVLEKVYNSYKDSKNFLFLPYTELKSDFESSINTVINHCELSKSDILKTAIDKQTEKQTNFSSSHDYSLDRFNLNEKTIEQDTPFYKRFMEEQKKG